MFSFYLVFISASDGIGKETINPIDAHTSHCYNTRTVPKIRLYHHI